MRSRGTRLTLGALLLLAVFAVAFFSAPSVVPQTEAEEIDDYFKVVAHFESGTGYWCWEKIYWCDGTTEIRGDQSGYCPVTETYWGECEGGPL